MQNIQFRQRLTHRYVFRADGYTKERIEFLCELWGVKPSEAIRRAVQLARILVIEEERIKQRQKRETIQ